MVGQSQKVLSAVDLKLIKSNFKKIFIVDKYTVTKDKNGEREIFDTFNMGSRSYI